jgi:hypothetical protein
MRINDHRAADTMLAIGASIVFAALALSAIRGESQERAQTMRHSVASSAAPLVQPAQARGVPMIFAEALAIVAAHEGALSNARDTALVYQATLAHGSTDAQRLRWLRAHSPRALGLAPCARGNCLWSPNLTASDDAPAGLGMPAGWWERARAPQWRAVREYAQALVSERAKERPCREQPTTWGGAVDHARALRLGMRPCHCLGTSNEGWR